MKTIQVDTLPHVKVKRNKPLSIAAKIIKQAGFEDGQVINIIKGEGRVVLEAAHDPHKDWVRAAVKRSWEDIRAGRCSPAFDNMDDLIKWLNAPDD